MIVAYMDSHPLEIIQITAENQALLKNAIWIDLLSPSDEEDAMVKQCLGLDMPSSDDMHAIELSSRLYKDHGAFFMTMTMIAHSASPDPILDSVSFVLTERQLLTIRYIEPQAFKLFTLQLPKLDAAHRHDAALFIEMLDVIVDRIADILELVGRRLDDYSKALFKPQPEDINPRLDYRELLQQIGANGDLNTKARESLITFNRLIIFFAQSIGSRVDNDGQLRMITITKDITALSDHANFLSSKINFLLDATLGMVSIEQNNIIKIFSVAAVIFLPPTLIASIYGMNFLYIPELSWKYGYLIALALMIFAAWLPYKYFKRRKWL